MALARFSRSILSSLRSACVGGKKTAACGPLQAARACQTSPKVRVCTPPPERDATPVDPKPTRGVTRQFSLSGDRDGYARPYMDVAAFCRKSRVLVVAGKGGVGKTTITAALARMAAYAGLSVLVVELEGKPGVSTAFGRTGSLGYDESLLAGLVSMTGDGTVRARRITPDDALLEYLADHGRKRS